METVYLHWNVTNWITVILMAALGFTILSLGAQFWRSQQGA